MTVRPMLLGFTALAFFVAACAPPPELRDPNLLADTSLVSGEPCEAPCWRGITPGETAWRDALTVIEDAGDFETIQTQEAPEEENTEAIGAVWNVKGGPQCCQMVAEDGETVDLVFLRTRPDITVGELVEAHGEPSYAVGTPVSEDQSIINLIYPDVPMIIFAFVAGPTEGEISETSEIIGSLYTTSDQMDVFMQTNNLHEWEGYAPYSTYQNDEGSEFEITPSVTLTPTAAAQ